MISKSFYFSSKIEKDKGDREFKQLGLKSVHKIYVSPNRPNLRISVVKCKKEMRFKQLAGLHVHVHVHVHPEDANILHWNIN